MEHVMNNRSRYFPAMLLALSLAGVVSILVASTGGAYAGDRSGKGGSKTLRIVNTIHPIIVGRLHRQPGDSKQRDPYQGHRPPNRLPPEQAPMAGSVM
jgi:hypothetical protein